MEGFETTPQAAARLGVSESLARRWCREEKLPCKKIGRDWFVEQGAEPILKYRRGVVLQGKEEK